MCPSLSFHQDAHQYIKPNKNQNACLQRQMFFVRSAREGLYSVALIPTPGFNLSRAESGKYSSPVCQYGLSAVAVACL